MRYAEIIEVGYLPNYRTPLYFFSAGGVIRFAMGKVRLKEKLRELGLTLLSNNVSKTQKEGRSRR